MGRLRLIFLVLHQSIWGFAVGLAVGYLGLGFILIMMRRDALYDRTAEALMLMCGLFGATVMFWTVLRREVLRSRAGEQRDPTEPLEK